MSRTPLLLSFAVLSVSMTLAAATPNWTAKYPVCQRHDEILKSGPLEIGVRILTANASLAAEFKRALDYWSGILDLSWHEDQTEQCAIQLVDGERSLFESSNRCHCISARSQNPAQPGFEGWIAFNPEATLSNDELYRISVHELGHLFGLAHNPSARSVMYFLDLDTPVALDAADLRSLAGKHRLRIR